MNDYPRVEMRASCGGQGVFALETIAAGSAILDFTGPRCGRAHVEQAAAAGAGDGFLQIGPDLFVGLSGGPDDFVNHACEPNCYVRFVGAQIVLTALDDIAPGQELFFDYGVTQINFPFRFECLCGRASCRGEIGNYDELPPATLARYLAHGVVPPHVLELLPVASAG
jgi:hypothetical protein